MIFTATAVPSPPDGPPYIELSLDTENSMSTFTAITIRRDGTVIRAVPPVGSSVSVVFDYDAAYDVAATYTVEATTVTVTPGFTETWSSVAAWTGSGWSASAGTGTSSTDGATITRAASGTIGSLQSLDVDWTTVEILDGSDLPLVTIQADGDHAVVTGSDGQPVRSAGAGPFSLVLSDGTANFTGAGYQSVSAPYSGTPTKVGLVAALGDPLELLSFSGQGSYAVDAAVTTGGDIWVVDYYGNDVYRFDSSGTYLQRISNGTRGSANGQFSSPSGIAIDSSGNLFVADYGNNRIQKFNSSGVYQSKFGTAGTGDGQFNSPFALCIDSSSNIWVVDQYNHRVQKFNSSGTYQSKFGTQGSGNSQFQYPYGITRDSSNNLYVVDNGNNRVQKFNSSGTYQTQWGSLGTAAGQFNRPGGIESDSSNNIYVSDYGNSRVQKFSNVGVSLYQWDGTESGGTALNLPWSLTVDSSDKVFVLDTSNDLVRKFDSAQQVAVVDDVTVTIAPPAPVTIAGTATETLTGVAAWLIHPTTPSLSVKIDSGCEVSGADVYVADETARVKTDPASGRIILEIQDSDTAVAVSTSTRRLPDDTLQLVAADFATRDRVRASLKGNVSVLLRSPASWDLDMPEGWFSVGDVPLERETAPSITQENTLLLPLTPVRTPVIETQYGRRYADDVIAGGTYADAVNSGRTYLERLTG